LAEVSDKTFDLSLVTPEGAAFEGEATMAIAGDSNLDYLCLPPRTRVWGKIIQASETSGTRAFQMRFFKAQPEGGHAIPISARLVDAAAEQPGLHDRRVVPVLPVARAGLAARLAREDPRVDGPHQRSGEARVELELPQQRLRAAEVLLGPLDLEEHQPLELGRLPPGDQVGLRDAEPRELLGRDVDAVALEVIADVARDVRELEGGRQRPPVRDRVVLLVIRVFSRAGACSRLFSSIHRACVPPPRSFRKAQ